MSLSVSMPTSSSLASGSQVDLGDSLGQGGGRLLVGQIGRPCAEPFEHPVGHGVAFRMDPGGVQRVVAAGDLEEAGRLDERGLAQARHLAGAARGCGTARARGDARTPAGP